MQQYPSSAAVFAEEGAACDLLELDRGWDGRLVAFPPLFPTLFPPPPDPPEFVSSRDDAANCTLEACEEDAG
jgi:hypothetical protein